MRNKTLPVLRLLACLWAGAVSAAAPGLVKQADSPLTHGPSLGKPGSSSTAVWVRTREAALFQVAYSVRSDMGDYQVSAPCSTLVARDFTGWVLLKELAPDTRYFYAVQIGGQWIDTRIGERYNSFRTLPDAALFRDEKHNPEGRFNFSFEFGCGNQQLHQWGQPGDPVIYETMYREIRDKIHFHLVNGDWVYEERRSCSPEEWAKQNGVKKPPDIVRLARGRHQPWHIEQQNMDSLYRRFWEGVYQNRYWESICGTWENYKLYYDRSPNISRFMREVPMVVTFDDHEILNDVLGSGEVGLHLDARNPKVHGYPFRTSLDGIVERAVFRDIALQGWEDYLGWANPLPGGRRPIHFGEAVFKKSASRIRDKGADFSGLDTNQAATLLVQWGYGNTGVYEIRKVVDKQTLEIYPPAHVSETARYSIGATHYAKFAVSNCDFYLLDTKSFRTLHGNTKKPYPYSGQSMIGPRQKRWLMDEMSNSKADFFFVVSSVNFAVPHSSSGETTTSDEKDDAWTAHLPERAELIRFFKSIKKNVFILTGDLHNSFVIQVEPGVWEFASGPHSSPNHFFKNAGGIVPSGLYDSFGHKVKVKWSTGYLDDRPTKPRFPNYCVVSVTNAFDSPDRNEKTRWVAFPHPVVSFKYFCGITGELKYAESVSTLDLVEK